MGWSSRLLTAGLNLSIQAFPEIMVTTSAPSYTKLQNTMGVCMNF
jgi:hypothetical protein